MEKIDKNIFRGIFNEKKVLITGDTGFKGSWLAIWLAALGAKVYGYSLPPKSENDNFVKCGLINKITHIDGDIRDLKKLKNTLLDIKPEIVFHLAAQSLVLESYSNPIYTFETNIIGTVNIFEAVRQTKSVKVVINITSDKCYLNNEWVWGYKETDPLGGNDPYSASKGCSELITNSYKNSFFNKNQNCVIASARAGNVIGGGDWSENRIVPDFFRAIKNNKNLIIRNPNSTRPWQFILEPLSGYLNLAMLIINEGRKFSGPWNFGPNIMNETTVLTLIKKLNSKLRKGNKIIKKNNSTHESKLLRLDISKSISQLHWKPVLDIEEMINFTMRGYLIEIENGKIYEDRISQIIDYTKLAMQRKLNWAN